MISISEAQLSAWLAPVLWPFLRVLGIFGSSPLLSIRAIPTRTKICLAFLVALCAQASLEGQPVVGLNDTDTIATAAHEVGVGLAIGFAVRLVFTTVELAGELMALQMGLNFAMFFDMTSNSQASAVSRFYGNIAVLLFVVMNGHLMILMAVIKSYDAFPVNFGLMDTFSRLHLHTMGAELFSSALWMALPVIGLLLMVNLTLGIVSRVAPQMNIFALGFPVTLTVGLMGITAGLPLLETPMTRLLTQAIDLFMKR